jgi:hypothetical protein
MKLKIIAAVLILTLAIIAICIFTRPTGDAGRYTELNRDGSSYRRAWTGAPSLSERIAALAHLSSPSNYYRGRFDADKQALVASGYLVEVSVPFPDLKARVQQVRASLSNTLQQTGAYYEAKLDWRAKEVRLLCRKEDVSMWQRVLADSQ